MGGMEVKAERDAPWSNGVAFVPLIHGSCTATGVEPFSVVAGKSPRLKNGSLNRMSSSVCRRVST